MSTPTDPKSPKKGFIGKALEGYLETAELTPLLDDVRNAAQELNALADRANRYIETADQALADANVGIEVWLPEEFAQAPIVGSDGETIGRDRILVGYGKGKDGWGLAFRHCESYYNGPDGAEIELLKQASRDRRVEAYRWIPLVLARIAAVLRERKEKIERAPGTSE